MLGLPAYGIDPAASKATPRRFPSFCQLSRAFCMRSSIASSTVVSSADGPEIVRKFSARVADDAQAVSPRRSTLRREGWCCTDYWGSSSALRIADSRQHRRSNHSARERRAQEGERSRRRAEQQRIDVVRIIVLC